MSPTYFLKSTGLRITWVLAQVMVIILLQGSAGADSYDDEVSETIPPGGYYYGEMRLSSGQTVHTQLSVTGTVVDFYFHGLNGVLSVLKRGKQPFRRQLHPYRGSLGTEVVLDRQISKSA